MFGVLWELDEWEDSGVPKGFPQISCLFPTCGIWSCQLGVPYRWGSLPIYWNFYNSGSWAMGIIAEGSGAVKHAWGRAWCKGDQGNQKQTAFNIFSGLWNSKEPEVPNCAGPHRSQTLILCRIRWNSWSSIPSFSRVDRITPWLRRSIVYCLLWNNHRQKISLPGQSRWHDQVVD